MARLRSHLLVPALIVGLLALVPTAMAASGGTIVFQSNRGGPAAVYTVAPNGSDLRRLGVGLHPAISRDGTKIVFVRTSAAGAELWVLNTPDGKVERITDDAKADTEPAISADGSKIVFVGSPRPGGDPNEGKRQLFLIDADGSNERQLTHGPDTAGEPSFSPDGKRIVFVRTSRFTQLMTVTVGGDDLTPVTDRDERFTGPAAPSYSPDGNRILFDASDGGGDRIWTIGADGGSLDRVSKGDDEGVEPAYSPDGASIVFRRGRDLLTMDADGSGVQQLVAGEKGGNIHPSWGR